MNVTVPLSAELALPTRSGLIAGRGSTVSFGYAALTLSRP